MRKKPRVRNRHNSRLTKAMQQQRLGCGQVTLSPTVHYMQMLQHNPHWPTGDQWCAFHGFCQHLTHQCVNPGGILAQKRTGLTYQQLTTQFSQWALKFSWNAQGQQVEDLQDMLTALNLATAASYID